MAGIVLDLGDVVAQAEFAHGGIGTLLDLLLQHFAVPDYGGKRGAQFMAHVGDERAFREVRRLCRVTGSLDGYLRPLALGDIRQHQPDTPPFARVKLCLPRQYRDLSF